MTRRWLLVTLFACGNQVAPVAPKAGGCELHTTVWTEQPSVLHTPDGKPFVDVIEVTEAHATLDTRAHVTLRTKTLTLRGLVDGLNVHAKTPFLVGYAVPGPAVPMRFLAARDQVAFELAVPFTKATLRGEQPCSALALDGTAALEPRDAIAAPTLRETFLHTPVQLDAVELGFAESPRADVLAEHADRARVAIHADSLNPAEDVMFVGWVPKAALGAEPHGFGGSWATQGARMPPRERPLPNAKVVRCDHDVPLEVVIDGARHGVGAIAANAVIEILDDDLRIRDSGVELVGGARWFVAKTALAACAAIRP